MVPDSFFSSEDRCTLHWLGDHRAGALWHVGHNLDPSLGSLQWLLYRYTWTFSRFPGSFSRSRFLRSFPWPGLVSRVCGLSFCGCSFSISGVAQMFFFNKPISERQMFFLVVIIEIRRYLRINQVGQNISFDILEVPLKVLSLPVYWDSKPGSQRSFPASPDCPQLGTCRLI